MTASPDSDGAVGVPPALRAFAFFRVALRYHALSLVPLPDDDASLFRASYAKAWRDRLLAADVAMAELDACVAAAKETLAAGPNRLAPQVDILVRPDAPLDDAPLGRLETLLEPTYREAWAGALDACETCRGAFLRLLHRRGGLLAPVRLGGIDRLDVHLCPALHGAGRAARRGSTYVLALPLPDDEASMEGAFLQLLHECCHPLIDEALEPFLPQARPDTARGSPGHAAHSLREDAALVVGWHWLARDARLAPLYLAWVARFRRAEGLADRLAGALDLPQAARTVVLGRAAEVARAVSG